MSLISVNTKRSQKPSRNRRQHNNAAALIAKSMSPRMTTGSPFPKTVLDSVRVMYRGHYRVQIAAATPAVITVASLSGCVPGGATCWPSLRIVKLSVFGTTDGSITAIVGGSASYLDAETTKFHDDGTTGSRRAVLHITPSFAQSIRWYASTSGDTVVTLSTTNPTGQIDGLVEFTVEMVSPLATNV